MKKFFKELTIIHLILLFLGIFEVVCVAFTFLKLSLTALMLVYGMLCLLLLGFFIRTRQEHSFFASADNRRLPAMILALLLIACQLILVVFFQHNDADDSWYVGTSVTTCETGSLFVYSPYSGALLDWANVKDYILSPLPILWAACAKLLGIHPTVFSHNVVPVLVVCFAYVVYFLLGTELLGTKLSAHTKNSRSNSRFSSRSELELLTHTKNSSPDVWYFLVFVSILNLFGYYSTRTTGTFLLLRSWQGKAIYCAILLPLLFYYVLKVFKEPIGKWISGMFLTSLASCLTCFSAVTLTPLLIGAMCLTYAIAKKDIKVPLKMAVSIVPNVVLLLIYVLM